MEVTVELLEVLFSQVKILDLVSEQIALVQDGDRYIGPCPFNGHEGLVFSVDTEHNDYRCYDCHASGDIFSYVQNLKGLTFSEAVEYLVEKYQISPPLANN